MSKFAVIGTFYQRWDKTKPLLNRVLIESTRPPDEFWMMCESEADAHIAYEFQDKFPNLIIKVLQTPRNSDNSYTIIPYSNKINWALDHANVDYIVYLDNNSMPHIEKYRLMVEALDNNPEWGAVYCSQERTGFLTEIHKKDIEIRDAYCVLNYTQVMHKLTPDRWDLEMQWAVPNDLADARFWRLLHNRYGSFYPIINDEILDSHYMESVRAAGL